MIVLDRTGSIPISKNKKSMRDKEIKESILHHTPLPFFFLH